MDLRRAALALTLSAWAFGACRDRRASAVADAARRAPRVDASALVATSDGGADAGRTRPSRRLAAVFPLGTGGMWAVASLALSPDGALVLAGGLDGARAVSLSTEGVLRWRALRRRGCEGGETTALAVAPDGRTVVAERCERGYGGGSDETAAIWLDERGVERGRRVLARGRVWAGTLAFVEGDLLVAGTVTTYDRSSRSQVLGRLFPERPTMEMGFVARAPAAGAPRWIRGFEYELGPLVADPRTGDLIVGGKRQWEATRDGRAVGPGEWVARVASDGTTRWVQDLGGQESNNILAAALGPSGEAYVAGHHEPQGAEPGACARCVLMARIEPDGRVAWRRLFDNATVLMRPTSIALGPDAAVWVAGSFQGTMAVAGTTLTANACPRPTPYTADVFLWRLGPDGAPAEAWALGACEATSGVQVVVDARNRVFVASAARDLPLAGGAPSSGAARTAFVARFDP